MKLKVKGSWKLEVELLYAWECNGMKNNSRKRIEIFLEELHTKEELEGEGSWKLEVIRVGSYKGWKL